MSEVPLYSSFPSRRQVPEEALCEDRVLDGPASGEKGSKGRARPQTFGAAELP